MYMKHHKVPGDRHVYIPLLYTYTIHYYCYIYALYMHYIHTIYDL